MENRLTVAFKKWGDDLRNYGRILGRGEMQDQHFQPGREVKVNSEGISWGE
jgi:hypothetical protein